MSYWIVKKTKKRHMNITFAIGMKLWFDLGTDMKGVQFPSIELIMNWICQVPHWYFMAYEDILNNKKNNGEKLITRRWYNKHVLLNRTNKGVKN